MALFIQCRKRPDNETVRQAAISAVKRLKEAGAEIVSIELIDDWPYDREATDSQIELGAELEALIVK